MLEVDRLVAALNAGAVAYVVIGGMAVAAHGFFRATKDLDIVPSPDPANLDRLAGVLRDLGPAADQAISANLPGSVDAGARERARHPSEFARDVLFDGFAGSDGPVGQMAQEGLSASFRYV